MMVIKGTLLVTLFRVLVVMLAVPFGVIAFIGFAQSGFSDGGPFLVIAGAGTGLWVLLGIVGRRRRIEVSRSAITRITGRRRSTVDLDRLVDIDVAPDGPLTAYSPIPPGSGLGRTHRCSVTDVHGEVFADAFNAHPDTAALWQPVLAAVHRAGLVLGGPGRDVLAWHASDGDGRAVAADRAVRPHTGSSPAQVAELARRGRLPDVRVTAAEVIVGPGRSNEQRVSLVELVAVELAPDTREPYANGPLQRKMDWGLRLGHPDWPKMVLRDRAGRALAVPVDNQWTPSLPFWQHVHAAVQRRHLPLTADAHWLLRYLAGLRPNP